MKYASAVVICFSIAVVFVVCVVAVGALRQANFDTATAADGVDITSGCCCLSHCAPKLPQLV